MQRFNTLIYFALKNLQKRLKSVVFPFLSIVSGIVLVMVTYSLNRGFNHSFVEKILSIEGTVTVKSLKGLMYDYNNVSKKLKQSGYSLVSSQLMFHAVAQTDTGTIGLKVIGTDNVSAVPGVQGTLSLNSSEIIVGAECARELMLKKGDVLKITTADDSYILQVAGFFETGLYDYNLNIAYVSLPAAQEMMVYPDVAAEIKIFDMKNPDTALKIAAEAELSAESWQTRNSAFVSSLVWEQRLLGILVLLVLMLASFAVYSNLVFHVFKMQRDIRVFYAFGLHEQAISAIFFFEGILMSFFSCVSGIITGYIVIGFIKKLTVPPVVYMISEVPLYLEPKDILFIFSASFILCCFLSALSSFLFSRQIIHQGANYSV